MKRSARNFAMLFIASDVSQKLRSAMEFGAAVAIIMALTTLAIRNFETYIVQSQIMEAFGLMSTVRIEMVAYRAEHGEWPAEEPDLHNSTLGQDRDVGNFVDHLELLEGGAISAVFDNEASASNLKGRRLTFRPMIVSSDPSAPIFWACGAYRVPPGFTPGGNDETDIDPSQLPSACREY
ncbi:MAG: hypothetical protein DRR42_26340 [Gammaproteobacteria bacterium]|nr:MAG: hypothetical protein DRR42_26340 [Gammaproteobacteria bacterium]